LGVAYLPANPRKVIRSGTGCSLERGERRHRLLEQLRGLSDEGVVFVIHSITFWTKKKPKN